MADDALHALYPDIVWAPFFMHGKFRYWKAVGRSKDVIGKDGKSRPEFYFDAHVSGGSTWGRILPPGETPKDQPSVEAPEQPKRPPSRGSDADFEEEDF